MDTHSAVASRYCKRLSAHVETIIAQLRYVQEQLAMEELTELDLDALSLRKQAKEHQNTTVDVDCMQTYSHDDQGSFPSGVARQQCRINRFQKPLADPAQHEALQGNSQTKTVTNVEFPRAECDGGKMSTAVIKVAHESSADVHAWLRQHQTWMLQAWMVQQESMITRVVSRILSERKPDTGFQSESRLSGKWSVAGSSGKRFAGTLNMAQVGSETSQASTCTSRRRSPRMRLRPISPISHHSQSCFSLAQADASRLRTPTIKSFEVLKACHKTTRMSTNDLDTARRKSAVKKSRLNLDVIQSEPMMERKPCRSIVGHEYFETCCGCLILTNALFVGFQVRRNVQNRDNATAVAVHADFYVVSAVYAALFTLELWLRICADGYRFFRLRKSWFWNYFDMLIVLGTIFELVLDTCVLANGAQNDIVVPGNMKGVRMLRILWLIRVVRITILRVFHALRVLAFSIIASSTGLIWIIVVLLGLLYMVGILFTQAVTDYYIDARTSEKDVPLWTELNLFWGTLPRSMFTLFKSISGGLDWHDCVYPLYILGPHWIAVFIFFVSVSYFSILNVVTGIFCQGVIERTQQDQDLLVASKIANAEKFQRRMREMFHKLDVNNSGLLTILEFEANIHRPDIEAFFLSLDVDTSDAWALFKILDSEEDNEIDIDEFVLGLMKLQGRVKKCDILQVEVVLDRLNAKQSIIIDSIMEIREEIKNILGQDGGKDPYRRTSGSHADVLSL